MKVKAYRQDKNNGLIEEYSISVDTDKFSCLWYKEETKTTKYTGKLPTLVEFFPGPPSLFGIIPGEPKVLYRIDDPQVMEYLAQEWKIEIPQKDCEP